LNNLIGYRWEYSVSRDNEAMITATQLSQAAAAADDDDDDAV